MSDTARLRTPRPCPTAPCRSSSAAHLPCPLASLVPLRAPRNTLRNPISADPAPIWPLRAIRNTLRGLRRPAAMHTRPIRRSTMRKLLRRSNALRRRPPTLLPPTTPNTPPRMPRSSRPCCRIRDAPPCRQPSLPNRLRRPTCNAIPPKSTCILHRNSTVRISPRSPASREQRRRRNPRSSSSQALPSLSQGPCLHTPSNTVSSPPSTTADHYWPSIGAPPPPPTTTVPTPPSRSKALPAQAPSTLLPCSAESPKKPSRQTACPLALQ